MNRVIFFGYDEPTRYYRNAKILHLTSAYEGFGNVLIEAQSHGTIPILFNSYSAASDIINDNTDGKIIQPFDIKEFIHTTIMLVCNPKLQQNMAKEAKRNVDRYSFENVGRRWEHLFMAIH